MKKFLSVLLAFAMLFSTVSFAVSAEAEDAVEAANWIELADTDWYTADADEYTLTTAAELAGLAKLVNEGNNFAKKTIKLDSDIDLENIEWTPIGFSMTYTFKGTFDGQENTISNLKCVTKPNRAGLFGNAWDCRAIVNVNIENAELLATDRNAYVAPVLASGNCAKLDNCHVSGIIKLSATGTGGRYVGGIAGNVYGHISNCTVTGTTQPAVMYGGYVGGIAGFLGEGSTTLTNCTAENIVINGPYCGAGISGMAHYGNTIKDNTVKNVSITNEEADRRYYPGMIVGQNNGRPGSVSYVINNITENVNVINQGEVITSHSAYPSSLGSVIGVNVVLDGKKLVSGEFEYAPPAEVLMDNHIAYELNGSYRVGTLADAANAVSEAKNVETEYKQTVDVKIPEFITSDAEVTEAVKAVKVKVENADELLLTEISKLVDEVVSTPETADESKVDVNLEFGINYEGKADNRITLEITPLLIARNADNDVLKTNEIDLEGYTVNLPVYTGLDEGTEVKIYHKADDAAAVELVCETAVDADGFVTIKTDKGFSTYYVETSTATEENEKVNETGNITLKLEAVEGVTGAYDINLLADENTQIYRFDSADLTFELTPGKNEYGDISDIKYTVTEGNFIEIEDNPANENNFAFRVNAAHFTENNNNNGDRVSGITKSKINLGRIQFTGFGTFNFKVIDDEANNSDAIVNTGLVSGANDENETYTFRLNDTETTGKLIFDEAATDLNITLSQIKKLLYIELDFINEVKQKNVDYTGMTVKIEGNQGTVETVQLGSDFVKTDGISSVTFEELEYYINASGEKVLINPGETAPAGAKKDVDTRYTVVANLPVNDEYKITVEGDGYRTAVKVYTVLDVTQKQSVRFWNNVAASGSEKVNFLAGDIVKDNNINIYDLSAVVSYFRADTATEGYNQYDLNRDGNINTIDISNLLKSWNN